ncbi:TRAP transporter large permease [Xylophilus rhododendri]
MTLQDAVAGTPHVAADTGWLGRACSGIEHICAAVLALNVGVIFVSVILRYFLHSPVDWAEEVARALMVVLVFLGGATVLLKGEHVGIDLFRKLLPQSAQAVARHVGAWVVAGTAAALFYSSVELLQDSVNVTTPIGLPQWLNVLPVCIGSALMIVAAVVQAMRGDRATRWPSLALCVALGLAAWAWNSFSPEGLHARPWMLLTACFFGTLIAGVPIAFVLAASALIYFIAEPSLPMVIYSQQVMAGMDHFVLLAVPFFVLAGLLMEANGMSSRLIELLVRMFGRMRGSMNVISIVATAFFSGVSGSKLADIAAVSGIIVPAVRRTKQDPNETAAVLAASAVMAETIPPCVNLIIMGFVANISIGGLFIAGIVPAVAMAVGLCAMAIIVGRKVDPLLAFPLRKPMIPLLGGALVALVMVTMIGKGVTSGVATSTEVSAFAVVYALVVGGLAFRELTPRGVVRLFVKSASMAASIMFIVAAASSLAFVLTIEQLPVLVSEFMTNLAAHYGKVSFILASVLLMTVFGAILEGAPALIIFGPLLTPIAQQVGVHPLHFGVVMVVAMGLGLFSPPFGLGLFATCSMTGTRIENVMRPMMKYLVLLAVMLLGLIFIPEVSLWLPRVTDML